MGDKAFSTFQTDLKLELGQIDNLDTYLDDWVNDAYIDFCTRTAFWKLKFPTIRMFPELNSSDTADTVDGTAYVSTPTDAIQVYTVWDSTNDSKLTQIGWTEYISDTGRADTDSEGKPQYWTRYGGYIYLYPTPDDAYTLYIYYRARPSAMSGDDDTTDIATEWDEPILKLAVIKGMLKLKRYEDYKIEKAEWLDMMAGKIGFYADDRLDSEIIIKPSGAYHNWGNDR